MAQPIKPSEVAALKRATFPAYVIEAFNETIAEHWDGEQSTFTQNDVIAQILLKSNKLERHQVFVRGYLNVEPMFQAAGWAVKYEKPDRDENFIPRFTFSPLKKAK